jgi:hypothetical protein
MIPMRDGVKLHTKIFRPSGMREPLPFLFERTPYSWDDAPEFLGSAYKELAEDGYIFVLQNIRGKYRSEGVFVMQRPPKKPGDAKAVDECTDAYDTIEWLLANVPNHNGRVGMLGNSYDGWTSIMAAVEPHPALKAISPTASPADMWMGDDFHHNGAFRLSYGFEYAFQLESGNGESHFPFDRYDTYAWYLSLGSLANVNATLFKGKLPTWNDFVAHPDYDDFWRRQTVIPHIRGIKVPTLSVAGWWDQEDFYGPLAIYNALEKYDTKGLNHLVIGPWNHGGWNRMAGDRLGPITFDSSTGKFFREQIRTAWFAFYLKDRGTLDLPKVLTFEVGVNKWRRWDAWPPKSGTVERQLYLGANRSITYTPPKIENTSDSFVSDPAHPVPYRHHPIQATYLPEGSKWNTWLVEDQRFVDHRPDVLSWESAPLEDNLTLAGEVTAHIFASTTGSDADWIVKLIDVYPEEMSGNGDLAGYQLMVSSEVFRGRYHKSFEKAEPITPGAIVEYAFSLHTQNYTFKKGHRLMVQVQSSWFPLIDRNPQTFVPNIFAAKESDFQSAIHRIHRSPKYPSQLTLQVMASTSR